MKTEIVFEDREILVVYKPAGLATQTAKVGQADVVSELKNYLSKNALPGAAKGPAYLGVIHRLDQPVEGLLVFAKTKQAAAALTKQLSSADEGMLNKQYLAVLCGKPAAESAVLVDYLEKTPDNTAAVYDENDGKGKKAVLQYKILDSIAVGTLLPDEKEACGELSLAEICIETGRFHQIRAQFSHAGLPLVADRKYGTPESKALSDRLGVRNVALCAHTIGFRHPSTGKEMHFVKNPNSGIYGQFTF